MSADEEQSFLSRWSRRKRAARTGEPLPEPPPPVPPPLPEGSQPAATPPAPEVEAHALPDVESLQGLTSDYQKFLQPEVDEALRRTALKKLFADPHFNVMDGLDVYIDDYSVTVPIPDHVLRRLTQAAGLFLFDEPEKNEVAELAGAEEEKSVEAVAAVDVTATSCPQAPLVSQDDASVPGVEVQKG